MQPSLVPSGSPKIQRCCWLDKSVGDARTDTNEKHLV